MVVVEKRYKNSNGKWKFDSIYYDGLENGKKREKEYAKCFKNDGIYEYKVKLDGTHKKNN